MRFTAPLLLLVTIAAPAIAAPPVPNWSKGTPIDVTVTNDRFIPARLAMKRGRQYVLRIHNRSDRKHNFSAPEFFGLARVAPRDSGWVTDNKVDLAPRQSATLHIVAPDTPNSLYKFRSTNLLDAGENMKGEISVR